MRGGWGCGRIDVAGRRIILCTVSADSATAVSFGARIVKGVHAAGGLDPANIVELVLVNIASYF